MNKVNKHWSQEEIKFLTENYANNSFKLLSEKMGRSEGALRAKCHDLKLVKKDFWTKEEEDFLRENYEFYTQKELGVMMNRTRSSINIHASKMGLEKNSYYCDYDYFKTIDTEEKAYWLGFISADGWVDINKDSGSGAVGIEIQYGDIEHLRKFNKSIGGNYRIIDRYRECQLSKHDSKSRTCCLRVFSRKMALDLIKLEVVQNKTHVLKLVELEVDLYRHFIRGYFDGNGCITCGNRNKHDNTCKVIQTKIYSGSETMINNVRELLYSFGFTSYTYKAKDANCWVLAIGGVQNTIDFLRWMYDDSTIYLNRKFHKQYNLIKEAKANNPKII